MVSQPPIGIDLGTTFSVIAHLDDSGRPVTIQNAEGDALTPSVVLLDADSVTVGKEAVAAAAMEPERIADFAKRDMGCPVYSKTVAGKHYPPEVIQSFILEKLKRDAERKIGSFTQAVITVPAYFNEPRRKATQDAGILAGLEVLDIINEPTAAAIQYGVQTGFLTDAGTAKAAERVLVYDLGGGTFDVTLMDIDGDRYSAIATGGDVYLGGVDWNRRIADRIAEEYQAKHRFDLRTNPGSMQRLMQTAEDAKRALTARQEVNVAFDHPSGGIRFKLTRQEFERLTADLLERTRLTVRNVLAEAGATWKDVTRLLVVGGSTRMPMVHRLLEEESGKTVDCSLSADEAVAHGAAIYAGLLMKRGGISAADIKIRNVNSHNLGVLGREPSTGRQRTKVMIPRNTPLPARATSRFETYRDNQLTVAIAVVEGGDTSGQNATHIGRCIIRDLPRGLPAGTPVEIAFEYAENGRLTVKAWLPTIRRKATMILERSSGLSEKLLREWKNTLRSESSPLRLA